MKLNTRQIGNCGEYAAAELLKNKGCKILKRNFCIRGGELDIIAQDNDGRYIFAEVKTRKNTDYGMACEYVTPQKQERIIKTAVAFTGRTDVDMRFDVIEVYYKSINGKMVITNVNHIENAF